MMPDIPGLIVGLASVAVLIFLFLHADALGDGNIDRK